MKNPKSRKEPVPQNLVIRKYEDSDFLPVAELVSRFFSFHRAFLNYPPMKMKEAKEALREDILSPDSSILVCERNRKILGFARYELHEKAYFGRELMVDETYRRQGIGRLLLSEVERIVKEKGHQLYISIVPKNEAAIRFFHSAGYDILNTIELTKNPGKEGGESHQISILNVELRY